MKNLMLYDRKSIWLSKKATVVLTNLGATPCRGSGLQQKAPEYN